MIGAFSSLAGAVIGVVLDQYGKNHGWSLVARIASGLILTVAVVLLLVAVIDG